MKILIINFTNGTKLSIFDNLKCFGLSHMVSNDCQRIIVDLSTLKFDLPKLTAILDENRLSYYIGYVY